jgi:hypothetical protein
LLNKLIYDKELAKYNKMLLSNHKKDKTLETLKKHLDLEKQLLELFETEEETEIEEFLDIIKSLKKLRSETIKKFQLKKEIEKEIEDNIKLVREKPLDPELVKSYEETKNEIGSIYTSLEKDSIPTFNLNIVTNFIELFSKFMKDDYEEKKIELKGQILILSENDEKHNLQLNKNKKVILTKRNFDLSSFTHDELVEILRFLDLIIIDISYDYLRAEIVSQISSISNISTI